MKEKLSLYFVNDKGELTSNHGYKVTGIRGLSGSDTTLLFALLINNSNYYG